MKNKFGWIVIFLFSVYGFNTLVDKSISVGNNFRFVERDTNFVAIYGDDTVRFVLTRAGNNLTLGPASNIARGTITAETFNGTTGASAFDKAWVNSTVGVSEDFYVEGDSKMTGYLDVDTTYSRAIRNISTTIDESASMPGVTLAAQTQCKIYMKGDKLIIAYNKGPSDLEFWYLDLTSTTDQHLIYSATEP